MIVFPNVRESESFLDEFACEVFEYDDDQRAGRFVHPETTPDDALHATNYALLLGVSPGPCKRTAKTKATDAGRTARTRPLRCSSVAPGPPRCRGSHDRSFDAQ